jgi:nitrogen fixation NifU-like protein
MGEETFLDHVRNPRNVGLLEDANVVIQAGDPECSDKLVFFVRIEGDVVRDIRFLIEGCETTVATSSAVTGLVMGQSLDAVMALDTEAVAAVLDGLPEEKIHCPTMAVSALHAAVRLYRATPRGEASSVSEMEDTFRVVSQVLNQPLSQVYSAEYDL